MFHEAARLSVVHLGPETPLGYVRSLDQSSNATEFWVVEKNGTKAAIILNAAQEQWQFDAVPLIDEDDIAWSGVVFGEVEVRVDLTSGSFSESPRYSAGCVTIFGGLVRISAKVSRRPGERVTFDVGKSAPTDTKTCGVFTRWQLVQREGDREPVVLFERG